jgi:transposase
MHYIGIDWADTSHQIAILTAEGQCISEFAIEHTHDDVSKLCRQLEMLAPVQVSIERPNGLLVDQLLEAGIEIYVIPPRIAAHRRPRRSKDDRGDAYLLANLLRTGDEDCRQLQRHGSTVETLRQLLQAFEQLQRQQLRTANQLRQIVKQYYPVLPSLFSDVATNISLAFLEAYPDPNTAQQLTYTQLEQFLQAQHYPHMRRLDTIYQGLRRSALEATVWQGLGCHAQVLVPILRLLNQQMTQIKREIRTTFAQHPEADWWQSLPGSGELTAPRLLAWIGDNRSVFPTAAVLQARAGTVPVTRRSGKSHVVRFRWACDKTLRKALMDFARNSIKHSGWARSYYIDQLERGHDKNRAMRGLANRWARVIWTIWYRREAYNEVLHVANRSRKGKAVVR